MLWCGPGARGGCTDGHCLRTRRFLAETVRRGQESPAFAASAAEREILHVSRSTKGAERLCRGRRAYSLPWDLHSCGGGTRRRLKGVHRRRVALVRHPGLRRLPWVHWLPRFVCYCCRTSRRRCRIVNRPSPGRRPRAGRVIPNPRRRRTIPVATRVSGKLTPPRYHRGTSRRGCNSVARSTNAHSTTATSFWRFGREHIVQRRHRGAPRGCGRLGVRGFRSILLAQIVLGRLLCRERTEVANLLLQQSNSVG